MAIPLLLAAKAAIDGLDGGAHCEDWAANGECGKNPEHMLCWCALACVNAGWALGRNEVWRSPTHEILEYVHPLWPGLVLNCRDRALFCSILADRVMCEDTRMLSIHGAGLSLFRGSRQDHRTFNDILRSVARSPSLIYSTRTTRHAPVRSIPF